MSQPTIKNVKRPKQSRSAGSERDDEMNGKSTLQIQDLSDLGESDTEYAWATQQMIIKSDEINRRDEHGENDKRRNGNE